VVLKIDDIGYTIGDIVYYYISFRFASATTKVHTKDLLFCRPRVYITKLKEADGRITFRIQRVLAKSEDPAGDTKIWSSGLNIPRAINAGSRQLNWMAEDHISGIWISKCNRV